MKYTDKVLALISVAVVLAGRASWALEPGCFHTPAEAVMRSGTQDAAGYRLESVERDAFAEVHWARVRSCAYPARPSMLMPLAPGAEISLTMRRGEVQGTPWQALARPAAGLPAEGMQAGHRVTLVIREEKMRVEVGATALGSAPVGEHVKVRLEQMAAGGAEHVEEGIVRSATLVEVAR